MNRKKIQNIVLLLFFLLILFTPIITINKVNGKMSENEKRYLATFPTLIDANGKLVTNGLRSGIVNWLNDNIGFRDAFIKIHSNISFKMLKKSPNEKVEIGRDGWYYYTYDDNLKIASGDYPLTEEMLERINGSQERIKEYYNSQGIEYVLVLAPSKASIYPENINSGDYTIRTTPVDIIANYLENNSSVNVINIKDSLLEAKKSEQVYFKTDTHWNESGAYVGYQTVINQLNLLGLIDTKPIKVEKVESTFIGEFSAMMGDENILGAEKTKDTEIVSSNSEKLENISIGQVNTSYNYHNPSVSIKKVLMYGDSMFGNWNMPELLAENFSDFSYIWSYEMLEETTELVKPDIVIYEIAERHLNKLGEFNKDITFHLLNNPQAEILSENTPLEVERGNKYDVDITVKNSGDESWSNLNSIRLCIWQDGIDHGYRVDIPYGIEIKPGEEYTFTLKNFEAPPSNSTYIEYQMLQEGIVYFGEKKRVDVMVKDQ